MTTTHARPSVLPSATPEELGLDPARLEQLYRLIESHIAAGKHPGAQVAIARNGRLAALRSFGNARTVPEPRPARDDTLWLLFSQTKVIIAAAIWQLVDRGALRFADKISEHIPEFASNGKGEITLFQVLTHQGGFPSARVSPAAWADHALLRKEVCDFTLEWTPGSKVLYHGLSAHWVCAVLIEAVTGRDYREVVRKDLLDPLGLADIQVGVPAALHDRCAVMHPIPDPTMDAALPSRNGPEFRLAGVPGGGGYGTAAAMAAFYQMLLAGGQLNGVRVLSPRMVQYVTRNHTGDRIDEGMGMPMHRGLGPHVRGLSPTIRGLGTIASPVTFGHGGAGSSYSWADPESGVSFSYLTNARAEEPWHSYRIDTISTLAHAAIVA